MVGTRRKTGGRPLPAVLVRACKRRPMVGLEEEQEGALASGKQAVDEAALDESVAIVLLV